MDVQRDMQVLQTPDADKVHKSAGYQTSNHQVRLSLEAVKSD